MPAPSTILWLEAAAAAKNCCGKVHGHDIAPDAAHIGWQGQKIVLQEIMSDFCHILECDNHCGKQISTYLIPALSWKKYSPFLGAYPYPYAEKKTKWDGVPPISKKATSI